MNKSRLLMVVDILFEAIINQKGCHISNKIKFKFHSVDHKLMNFEEN